MLIFEVSAGVPFEDGAAESLDFVVAVDLSEGGTMRGETAMMKEKDGKSKRKRYNQARAPNNSLDLLRFLPMKLESPDNEVGGNIDLLSNLEVEAYARLRTRCRWRG